MRNGKKPGKILGVALLFVLIGSVLGFTNAGGLCSDVASAAPVDGGDSAFGSAGPYQTAETENVTATGFRFPLNGDWSVTLGFGDATDLGIHLGEDVFCPGGTEVYASAEGVVRFAGPASGWGAAVVIEHYTGSEYVCTFYGHLSSQLGLAVSPGEEISKGQLIGYTAYDDEDGGGWSPHIHFGIGKGAHRAGWDYYDYDPPGNLADWYDPSDFIEAHEEKPEDRSLVKPSEGDYQDRVYWLQNGKLYWITEFVDNDSALGSTIEQMSSLPRWGEDKINELWPGPLAGCSGWPDGVARFITTGSESDGLLLRESGSSSVYFVDSGGKIWFPDAAAVDYAGYGLADTIDVTGGILDLFTNVADNAEPVGSSGDVTVGPGQPFNISLEMKNTGTSVWREKLQYYLGWRSGLEPFPNSDYLERLALGSSDNITPEASKGWRINGIVAPRSPGTYVIVWQMVREGVYWFGDTACIKVTVSEQSKPPSMPYSISGPAYGYPGTSYSYSTSAIDPDGDEVKYAFDWGDGTTSETGYVNSDTSASASHSWSEAGIYYIRAKATDSGGASSGWSGSKMVVIESVPEASPAAPTLSSPEDDSVVSGTSVTFKWNPRAGADEYFLEVNTSSSFDEEERKFYERVSDVTKTIGEIYRVANGVKRWFPDKAAVEQAGYTMADVTADFPGDGTEYYWRVRAHNDAGWGAWSDGWSFINVDLPSAPTLTSPEDRAVVSGTSVTFNWEAPDGASKYLLEVNTDANWGAETRMFYGDLGDVTEYEDTAYLNNATEYYWRVRAGNDAGWGAPSSSWSFISATPTLSSPEDGASASGASVTFEWEASDEVDEYLLEVATDPKLLGVSFDPEWDEDTGKFHGDVGNVTEYEDTGYPNDGTTFYWRVWASKDGTWKFRSEIWSFINTALAKPSAPTLSSPKEDEDGNQAKVSGMSVTFEWEASDEVDEYWLEVNTNASWDKGTRKFCGNVGDVTEFTDRGYPNNGTTYYWRVRAGNATGWSDWCEGESFTNASRPSPNLSSPEKEGTDGTKVKVSGTSITFQWQASEGANEYQLEVNKSPPLVLINGSWEFDEDALWKKAYRHYRGIVSGVSKTVTGFPDDGTEYYWRVRARSDAGWSAWSETWSFINGDFDEFSEESVPVLSSPADGERVFATSVTFKWTGLEGAYNYQLEVNSSPYWDKRTRQYRQTVGDVLTKTVPDFANDGTRYYWRVRARNAGGWSNWSESQSFINGPP